MKANELRIGNMVYNTKGIVDYINLEALSYAYKEKLNQINPILLTEEYLLRFGFEQQENEYWYKKNILSISVDGKTYEIDGSKESYCVMRNNPIVFVHQLQNLYFALTGEELTLKQ